MKQNPPRLAAPPQFTLKPANGVPLAQQIRQHLTRLITSGQLHPGDLLPAVRSLAAQLSVNVNTVRAAYERLERDGLVKTSQGIGTEVLSLSPGQLVTMAGAETTNSVGLILPSLGNPFYHAFLEGVESVAHQDQTLLLVCNTHGNRRELLRSFAQLSAEHIEGMIVASSNVIDLLPPQSRRRPALPIVTADWPDSSGYCVLLDLAKGSYLATRHLIEHGHRRIALLTLDRALSNVQPVNEGYKRALRSARIELDPSLVVRVPGWDMEAGRQGARQLLELRPRPTALFAITDMLALGALEVLRAAGLRIPQNLALSGFNDIPFAALVTPALTTVATPAYELGRESMKMLNSLRAGKVPSRKRVTLPTSLVIRESCGEHGRAGK